MPAPCVTRVLAIATGFWLSGPALADVIVESALVAPETLEPGDDFGISVGIGAEQLFGGAPGAGSEVGEVLRFTRVEGVWQSDTTITNAPSDQFGFTLALSTDEFGDPWIAVGEERFNTLFGTVAAKMTTYLFSGESTPTRSTSGSSTVVDDFASTIAISGDGAVRTAIAGAPRRVQTTDAVTSVAVNFVGTGYASADIGAIVTFSGGGGAGAQGAIASVSSGEINSITLTEGGSGYTSNPSVLIPPPTGGGIRATGRSSRSGEVGGVKFLDLDGAGTQFLTPSDSTPGSRFGRAVAVNGAVAAASSSAGVVTLLERDVEGDWSVSQAINPPEGASGFGAALALGGNLLLVGAPSSDSLAGTDVGSAFLYALADPSEPLLELVASTPIARELLGLAVAIGDDFVALSAPGSDPAFGVNGTVIGRVLTFDLETGEEVDEFAASMGSTDDYFGTKISVTGSDLAVGAPGHNEDRGAIFVFEIPVPEPAGLESAFAALFTLAFIASQRRVGTSRRASPPLKMDRAADPAPVARKFQTVCRSIVHL